MYTCTEKSDDHQQIVSKRHFLASDWPTLIQFLRLLGRQQLVQSRLKLRKRDLRKWGSHSRTGQDGSSQFLRAAGARFGGARGAAGAPAARKN